MPSLQRYLMLTGFGQMSGINILEFQELYVNTLILPVTDDGTAAKTCLTKIGLSFTLFI